MAIPVSGSREGETAFDTGCWVCVSGCLSRCTPHIFMSNTGPRRHQGIRDQVGEVEVIGSEAIIRTSLYDANLRE